MKQFWVLFFILIVSLSCKQEEIQAFNELTEQEQDVIRSRGTAQCNANYSVVFNRWKTMSADVFTNSSYQRGRGFNFVFKKADASIRTVDIQVWKQDSDEIYFYVIDSVASDNYFLRIKKTDNELMIDDLLEAFCSRPILYTSSTGDSGPLTMLNEYTLTRSPNYEEIDDTYSMPFTSLAYFANFRLRRVLKTIRTTDNVLLTTDTYTSTLTNKDLTFASNDWSNATYFSQRFCVIKRDTKYRFGRERNVEGFKIDLTDTAGTCPTAKPGDWDLTI